VAFPEAHHDFVFGPLGADADLDDAFAGHGAGGGDELFAEAVVAADEAFVALGADAGFMDDHGGVALVTFEPPITVGVCAGDERGVAAAVEQEDGLLAVVEGLVDGAFQSGANDGEGEGLA